MKKTEISRRDFLRGMAAGAVSVAGMGMLTACGSNNAASAPAAPEAPAAESAGIYTPGTYSASAQGMGTVKMTATFDANSITAIELDVSGETPDYGQKAKDELIKQLMDAQSPEIDGVAGATITTDAAKKCLKDCIAQAKGEASAPAADAGSAVVATEGSFVCTDILPEDVAASAVVMDEITEFAQEIDCDIVVAGAGAAGVVAAVKAAEEGKKVVVLQKEAMADSQGNCASSIIKGGSTERGLKRWITLCSAFNSWRSKPELLQAYIDNSEEALRYLIEKGGFEYPENSVPDPEKEYTNGKEGDKAMSIYQWSFSGDYTGVWKDCTQSYDLGEEHVQLLAPWFGPKPKSFGTLVANILDDAMAEYGDKLDVHFSTPIVQLIQENGEVKGCIGKSDDGYIKINAKSVILATGAYENNPTMVRRFCPDIETFDKKVYHRTGDGNILAILAGGVMEPVAHSHIMHDFDAGLMWDEPFLTVNMEGNRFMNEDVEMAYISNPLRYQPWYKGENLDEDHKETGSQGWYCQIYDNDYMSYGKAPVPDVVMARYMKNERPEEPQPVFEHLIDTFKADTIEELAEQMGLPVDNVVAAVNRYNELCESGNDDDFGKESKYMHKVATAPFWGIRRHIRCSSITAGVETDQYSRVVTQSGEVIPGLYAVGNLGGKFFGAPDYPFFQGGLSLGHAVTFGYIAGKHAAENA